MSMRDLFRRDKRSSPPYVPLDRTASCAAIPTTRPATTSDGCGKPALRRCATTASGWGIVPVLNELERRSSNNTLLRRPSAQQLVCLNCRRLYFPATRRDSPLGRHRHVGLGDQFCSLDCRSSFACQTATQDLVDLQLLDGSATSSDGDGDAVAVVTWDDDTDFSF